MGGARASPGGEGRRASRPPLGCCCDGVATLGGDHLALPPPHIAGGRRARDRRLQCYAARGRGSSAVAGAPREAAAGGCARARSPARSAAAATNAPTSFLARASPRARPRARPQPLAAAPPHAARPHLPRLRRPPSPSRAPRCPSPACLAPPPPSQHVHPPPAPARFCAPPGRKKKQKSISKSIASRRIFLQNKSKVNSHQVRLHDGKKKNGNGGVAAGGSARRGANRVHCDTGRAPPRPEPHPKIPIKK